jgi:predicted membrane protein
MVNVISIFGGITIQVPKQWDVNIRTRAVFGGVESRRTPPDSPEGQLTVTGWCFFGGVKIRS